MNTDNGGGSHTFFCCQNLTTIYFPSTVTIFEPAENLVYNDIFGSPDLTTIVVDKNNPVFDSRDNCNAIIETATNTLIAGCQTTIIPNGVTSIGDVAFSDYLGLTNIAIPVSVTSIGDEAFINCSNLTRITIPNSVTSIGSRAFGGCTCTINISQSTYDTVIANNPNAFNGFYGKINVCNCCGSTDGCDYENMNYCEDCYVYYCDKHPHTCSKYCSCCGEIENSDDCECEWNWCDKHSEEYCNTHSCCSICAEELNCYCCFSTDGCDCENIDWCDDCKVYYCDKHPHIHCDCCSKVKNVDCECEWSWCDEHCEEYCSTHDECCNVCWEERTCFCCFSTDGCDCENIDWCDDCEVYYCDKHPHTCELLS